MKWIFRHAALAAVFLLPLLLRAQRVGQPAGDQVIGVDRVDHLVGIALKHDQRRARHLHA